ncbi:aminoacyl-tRNA hydrolase [Agilicoccus flavus]|uniref:aminoacyl-tRNA hydrolase n=1 Tax=Agilicoccus flavus TaxID=2775968 RepID=UPI001CF60A47|nr:aminoacyl-tRNA hydrolase [Agilicoccus flavus]
MSDEPFEVSNGAPGDADGVAPDAERPSGSEPSVAPEPPAEFGAVLAPLRRRYASWLGLDDAGVSRDRDENPDRIRALQLLLRLERGGAPSHRRALELSATACALLCLDPRSAPGGAWHEEVAAYCGGHIRKVGRRARGAAWAVTADLPGLTLTAPGRLDRTTATGDDRPADAAQAAHEGAPAGAGGRGAATDEGDGLDRRDGGRAEADGTQVRALVPGLVAQLDRRIAKLQVGGTDLPRDTDPASDPLDPLAATPPTATDALTPPDRGPVLRLHLPAGSGLTTGKLMAQTGHAGMIAAALAAGDDPGLLRRWWEAGCPAVAVEVDEAEWSRLRARLADPAAAWRDHRLAAVRDAGFTEVEPGTTTVVARLG